MASLTLKKLIESYRDIRNVSESCYTMKVVALRYLEAHLERPATIRDLNEDTFSKWVGWLSKARSTWTDNKLSPRSVKNYRNELITLWRFAVAMDLVKHPPANERITNVKVPRPNPVAWDADQLRQLLKAAKQCPGVIGNGIPRNRYFPTVLKVAYQSGLRRGDLLSLKMSQVDIAASTISVVMSKTGLGHVCRLNDDAMADLVDLHQTLVSLGEPLAATPLAYPGHMHSFYYWWRKIAAAAGVPYGALQQMRRTSATLTEVSQPGTASRLLGHTTPGLAQQYYIDRSKLPSVAPPSVI